MKEGKYVCVVSNHDRIKNQTRLYLYPFFSVSVTISCSNCNATESFSSKKEIPNGLSILPHAVILELGAYHPEMLEQTWRQRSLHLVMSV